jgi:hypothetical protein
MWDTSWNEQELAGRADNLVLQGFAPTCEDFSLEHIDPSFVADMHVWFRLAAGRDDD